MNSAIDDSTYAFLLAEYGENGARQAIAEIEFWQANARMPKWAMFIQQIIDEGDGNIIYVHFDSSAQDSATTEGGEA